LAAAPLSEDEFDVKPQVGVDGWLASPKRTTQPAIEARTEPPSKADKPGSCDTPKGFGIKCMTRLDQCTKDTNQCCMATRPPADEALSCERGWGLGWGWDGGRVGGGVRVRVGRGGGRGWRWRGVSASSRSVSCKRGWGWWGWGVGDRGVGGGVG
ncbi:hypothetical protein C7M84_024868, partial [Penaeus vannamei]